jgi:hypothetical protein
MLLNGMIDFLLNVVFNFGMDKKTTDWKIITDLGGPSKVSDLLGFPRVGGQQRVQNWKKRGIPAQVKVDHPQLFLSMFAQQGQAVPSIAVQPSDIAPAAGEDWGTAFDCPAVAAGLVAQGSAWQPAAASSDIAAGQGA